MVALFWVTLLTPEYPQCPPCCLLQAAPTAARCARRHPPVRQATAPRATTRRSLATRRPCPTTMGSGSAPTPHVSGGVFGKSWSTRPPRDGGARDDPTIMAVVRDHVPSEHTPAPLLWLSRPLCQAPQPEQQRRHPLLRGVQGGAPRHVRPWARM
jgi:hypothetical protein